jgi:hypothetical protein
MVNSHWLSGTGNSVFCLQLPSVGLWSSYEPVLTARSGLTVAFLGEAEWWLLFPSVPQGSVGTQVCAISKSICSSCPHQVSAILKGWCPYGHRNTRSDDSSCPSPLL